jgi:hypothetical protein
MKRVRQGRVRGFDIRTHGRVTGWKTKPTDGVPGSALRALTQGEGE